jgi:hypothetical protein
MNASHRLGTARDYHTRDAGAPQFSKNSMPMGAAESAPEFNALKVT